MLKKTLCILSFSILFFCSWAQYSGGIGTGNTMAVLQNTTCTQFPDAYFAYLGGTAGIKQNDTVSYTNCSQILATYYAYYGGVSGNMKSDTVNYTTCTTYPNSFFAYLGGASSSVNHDTAFYTQCSQTPATYYAYYGGLSGNTSYDTVSYTSCTTYPISYYAYLGGNGSGNTSDKKEYIACIQTPNTYFAYFGGKSNQFSSNYRGYCIVDTPKAGFIADYDTICAGQSIVFSDTSLNNPMDWQWSFSGGTPNTSKLQSPQITYNSPGTYTVSLIVTNSLGSDTIVKTNYIKVLGKPSVTVTVNSGDSTVFCQGDSVTLSAQSSSANYVWSTGSTSSSITIYNSGSYHVIAADTNNCTDTSSTIPVSVHTIPSASILITGTASFCDGDSVLLSATTADNYLWNTGDTTQSIVVKTSGVYDVTLTNGELCSVTSSQQTVSVNTPLVINLNYSHQTYYNVNNGFATVTVNGSNSPYTYLWSTGETTDSIGNLAPGNYLVTVTDNVGCSNKDSLIVEALNCAGLTSTITKSDETVVARNDGTAKVTALGGIAPYTYLWSNTATADSIGNLSPSNYFVTITDSVGCFVKDSVIIESVNCSALSVVISKTNETIVSGNNGTAKATALGGITPYTYMWSSGETTDSIFNLSPNTYTLTVTDSIGCTATKSVTINKTNCSALSLTITKTNETTVSGNDGTAKATALGGITPYIYLWNTGETTDSIFNLSPDTYTLTVTDSIGCADSSKITINPFVCTLSVTLSSQHETAVNANDGQATAVVSGGMSPYSYLWSNSKTTSSILSLSPGKYAVTVTDSSGCQASDSTSIDSFVVKTYCTPVYSTGTTWGDFIDGVELGSIVNLNTGSKNGPSYNDYTAQSTSLTINQSYTLKITSGSYSYDTFAAWIDFNGDGDFTDSGEALGSFSSTSPYQTKNINFSVPNSAKKGKTRLRVRALSGTTITPCGSSLYGEAEDYSVEITNCSVISIVLNKTNENCSNCNNGSIAAIPSGGNTPYSYHWSNGKTSSSITNLAPGAYTVTVTDSLGCTQTGTSEVFPFSCQLAVSVTTTDESFQGALDGTAKANVSGGILPLAYLWSNGATTATLSGLSQGNYGVTVTDAANCTATSSGIVKGLCTLSLTITGTDESSSGASDGTAQAMISGGMSPYSYLWSNSETTSSILGLAPGVYSVTVTDIFGCSVTDFISIKPAILVSVLSPIKEDNSLVIYPNPASDILNVELFSSTDATYLLTDITGKVLISGALNLQTNTISLNQLSQGTYFLQVNQGKDMFVEKVIVISNYQR